MANYQELLSKAVGALPENNGAARREVYEKARKALVAQLRSISPPLPAREITQHRLELEDCIRQVEHEATEALIGGLKELDEETLPIVDEAVNDAPVAQVQADVEPVAAPVPAPAPSLEAASPEPKTVDAVAEQAGVKPVAAEAVHAQDAGDVALAEKPVEAVSANATTKAAPPVQEEAPKERPQAKPMPGAEVTSIDAIIARAEAAREKTAQESAQKDAEDAVKREARDAAEAKKATEREAAELEAKEKAAREEAAAKQARETKGQETAKMEVRVAQERAAQEIAEEKTARQQSAADSDANAALENALKTGAQGNATLASDAAVGAAMSRVREVDVEPATGMVQAPNGVAAGNTGAPVVASPDNPEEEDAAQLAVDRAIQVLDREARGDHTSEDDLSLEDALNANRPLTSGEARFASEADEEKSGNALTVFLLLAVVLLGAVGGGGYWAWREGFVDLDALFSSTETPPVVDDTTVPLEGSVETPDTGTPIRDVTADAQSPGPGNTATDVGLEVPADELATTAGGDKIGERLPSADETNNSATEPENSDTKVEDRLTTEPQPEITVPGQSDTGDTGEPAVATGGAQSLLLEASSDGTTGAVPFSGTIAWSRGVDELGQPTLIGTAKIPARNLGVRLLIRRNGDASLPASHLMEIDFDVSETFSGGAVAGLPGILLKNEELVQGAALVGASARVVGNSFLFALSAADQDVRNNMALLENNKWMDLALVYATGKRAIITLEKDDAAQAMFNEVLGVWRTADAEAASTSEADPAPHTDG